MGVVNTLSTSITAFDAVPPTLIDSHLHAGLLRVSCDYVSVAAADDNDSIYRVVRIPSNARICQVLVCHTAVGSGTDYNLGFYDVAAVNSGAVISGGESALADALNLSSARAVWTDISSIVGLTPANAVKRAWQLTSLTSDPRKYFDVAFKAIAVGTEADNIGLQVYWTL